VSAFTVRIDRKTVDEIFAHARETAPDECCGLLVGRRGSVERIVRTKNLEASPTRYSIDPADHFAAIHDARSQGQSVIGAYHSHPGTPAVPSASDISEARGGADFLYVIVSLVERGEVRAYVLRRGAMREVTLVHAAD
jgi:[CysO sulfur-carrier protein]-S-L-cysteine hydrolase